MRIVFPCPLAPDWVTRLWEGTQLDREPAQTDQGQHQPRSLVSHGVFSRDRERQTDRDRQTVRQTDRRKEERKEGRKEGRKETEEKKEREIEREGER